MERGENLLYQDAVKQIKQHLYRGDEIVVISASIDHGQSHLLRELRALIKFWGLQLELSGTGHLTGRFATANCYGEEKVKRLLQLYPDRTQYRLVVYGDSRGDKELLAFSDESYYKQFNR
ncbi:MAG: haloacid dehalogenase-like hydrolase [Bacteroides stercoris]